MNSSSGNEARKVAVAALVLALLCGSVGASRFMKHSAGAMASSVDVPPPPVPWWKHPPPPPLHIQWPPPVHHYVHHPPSPPPPLIDDDGSSPPPPLLQSPLPPHSPRLHQPPPPPPPDEDNTARNGRRLFSSDERNQLLVHTESSPGKCSGTGLSPGATPRPYGSGGHGAYVPVGAPHSFSPVPASPPSSGAPTILPPPPADNDTQAHTTMVSAMKYNQCTYTIITSTGNIEGGGTQADVNVEFFDKHGSSVLFVNLRSQSRNNFNQGATDTFTVVGDCVQSICKMRLSHDDSGPSPGWFVNTVTVSVLYQTHVFNVFEWLAKDEPPYSLSRVVSSCPA